jgi:hypothetical protein
LNSIYREIQVEKKERGYDDEGLKENIIKIEREKKEVNLKVEHYLYKWHSP